MTGSGQQVRVADIAPQSYQPDIFGVDVCIGNLCDPAFCSEVVRDVHTVLHFAATMGGMGAIHGANDFIIYQENHMMTLNLLKACVDAGVKKFLLASSACVYPEVLQDGSASDISLRESDARSQGPPTPQGLYGLQKLHVEDILHQFSTKLDIRIARFHNIYGPGGSWFGGKEKAPAALLRKVFAAKLAGVSPVELEIWGSGQQRRSFCYIDDAVDAIILLIQSSCTDPVNIGTEESVTIDELADVAVRCAQLDTDHVRYNHVSDKPVGVQARNSNNDFVSQVLQWSPKISLEEGMHRTSEWIQTELANSLAQDMESRVQILQRYQQSDIVMLSAEAITFALLLPITSRGSKEPIDCLKNLKDFANSLLSTTRDDSNRLGQRFRYRVYLAIDHDDEFLLGSGVNQNQAEATLQDTGVAQVTTIICDEPRGAICNLWRICARTAWKDGCDYFALMGDDVTLQDANWMSIGHDTFQTFTRGSLPLGFGCIAFTDVTFPGMPTFPIIHRLHLDIFDGEVIPPSFINQDGDPYLFQLYRRWGSSVMIPCRVSNGVGGSNSARYEKYHAIDWTFDTLTNATDTIETWLRSRNLNVERKLTLDVVIPCFRVNMSYLDVFLQLRPSSTCSTMFIIIIDNPNSPNIHELIHKYGHRVDVRIRVNPVNSGASASRNRGMEESSAEWVFFLDDDVTPQRNVLVEAEKVIRSSPSAAGFVGNTYFPNADSIFTAAVHLAGVTYFWDIANKIPTDIPWGVTANLIARRNFKDNVKYDLIFPKTGGGEDIDFCRQKREWSLKHGGEGFQAAPSVQVTHPWWNGSKRSYWRFYMWSKGDGALVKMYPQYTYQDGSPNGAETLLFCALLFSMGFIQSTYRMQWSSLLIISIEMITTCLLAHIIHDVYRHLIRDKERTESINTTVFGARWFLAVIESTFIRLFSEWGRVVGILERREYSMLGKRFDWFTGRWGEGPKEEERKNNIQRLTLFILILSLMHRM